jgi:hypothetical protein
MKWSRAGKNGDTYIPCKLRRRLLQAEHTIVGQENKARFHVLLCLDLAIRQSLSRRHRAPSQSTDGKERDQKTPATDAMIYYARQAVSTDGALVLDTITTQAATAGQCFLGAQRLLRPPGAVGLDRQIIAVPVPGDGLLAPNLAAVVDLRQCCTYTLFYI